MIPAIITLAVGVIIVIVSFFLTDGKKEDDALENGMQNIKTQLDQYCNSLVEDKKEELKKQGDEVVKDMQKNFDDVKNTSKEELQQILDSSRKGVDEYRESAKKEIEEMHAQTEKRIDEALRTYETSIEAAKKKMQSELNECESQLSEKAKKQMIEYINRSLAEAYEAYDPDDKSEKEPITYDESAANDHIIAEPAAEENVTEAPETETPGTEAPETEAPETEDILRGDSDVSSEEHVVVVENSPAPDSAFTVVEADDPEKMAEEIKEGVTVPAQPKRASSSPRRKKKKKSSPNRPIDIWDEGNDMQSRVADLHKKGLSIMEIANKLGIGVGEAKVMIDQIEENGNQ